MGVMTSPRQTGGRAGALPSMMTGAPPPAASPRANPRPRASVLDPGQGGGSSAPRAPSPEPRRDTREASEYGAAEAVDTDDTVMALVQYIHMLETQLAEFQGAPMAPQMGPEPMPQPMPMPMPQQPMAAPMQPQPQPQPMPRQVLPSSVR